MENFRSSCITFLTNTSIFLVVGISIEGIYARFLNSKCMKSILEDMSCFSSLKYILMIAPVSGQKYSEITRFHSRASFDLNVTIHMRTTPRTKLPSLFQGQAHIVDGFFRHICSYRMSNYITRKGWASEETVHGDIIIPQPAD